MAFALRRYRKALLASGLISRDELVRFERAVPRSSRPRDASTLARMLVEAGRLSDYQAAEIAAGRGNRLLLGNYAILAPLGAGGMGRVFKAWHRRMKRVVALKMLADQHAADAETIERFRREAQAAAQLAHPNIVAAYDADEAGGVCFLVMEYVEGPNLSEVVRREGPLPVATAKRYLLDAAHGLAHAHDRGFVHRDVKPSNLVLAPDGTVKVLDLGLARGCQPATEGELTQAGDVVGTVEYMAPEQARETRLADQRADIYSLGSTLYRLLTGEFMYRGNTPLEFVAAHREQSVPSLRAARDDVPRSLEAAYRKMVAKDPADRFQTMREVIAALSKTQSGRRTSKLARADGSGNGQPPSDSADFSGEDLQIVSSFAEEACAAGGTADRSAQAADAAWPRRRWLVGAGLLAAVAAAKFATRGRNGGLPIDHPAHEVDALRAPVAAALPGELARQWAAYLHVPLAVSNSLGMRLVLIPPGEFSGQSPAGTRRGVAPRAFYLGAHEVTVADFRRFVDETGYRTAAERSAESEIGLSPGGSFARLASNWRRPAGFAPGDRHPVVELTADDAEAFCRWLGEREQARYRLPTEDEWEHACRASSRAAWWFGDHPSLVGRYAWFGAAAQGRTHLVGLLESNPFGLHDMLGNAAEWCRASEPADANIGGNAALRGGAWSSTSAGELHASAKALLPPGGRSTSSGFRVVLEAGESSDSERP